MPRAHAATPGSARLFSESSAPGPPPCIHLANIDGASRGNPGPAAYAVVIRDAEGKIVLELAKKMGRETNNVAEYYALLAALDFATTHGIKALRIRSDSELLVRQMQGRYKVKSADLKPLYERAYRLTRQLQYFSIEHVRREMNRDADALANVALDSGDVLSATPAPKRAVNSSVPVGPETSSSQTKVEGSTLNFRARVDKGVLVPFDPLDLPDGISVDVEVQIRHE